MDAIRLVRWELGSVFLVLATVVRGDFPRLGIGPVRSTTYPRSHWETVYTTHKKHLGTNGPHEELTKQK